MKENTVVLSLEELDRLRDIEESHNKMLDWWVYSDECTSWSRTIKTYNKEEWVEEFEKDKKCWGEAYENQIDKLKEKLLIAENKIKELKKKKNWFSF